MAGNADEAGECFGSLQARLRAYGVWLELFSDHRDGARGARSYL
jgi:hypothetical protein